MWSETPATAVNNNNNNNNHNNHSNNNNDNDNNKFTIVTYCSKFLLYRAQQLHVVVAKNTTWKDPFWSSWDYEDMITKMFSVFSYL